LDVCCVRISDPFGRHIQLTFSISSGLQKMKNSCVIGGV
jgi:hypothetical protein